MNKNIELKAGDNVGEWTLIERLKGTKENTYKAKWLCCCSCGTKKPVGEAELLRGSSKSCGCMILRELRANIVGKKFGKLYVKDVFKKESSNNYMAICDCDCGTKDYEVKKHTLDKGKRTECKKCSMQGTKTIDLTGQTFGHLTVIEKAGKRKGTVLWLCRCVCGNLRKNTGYALTKSKRKVKSCGCQRLETISWKKHGQYGTPLYNVWSNMMKRCFNENNKAFLHYGGRGITVCEEWHDVTKFVEWCESNGYEKGLQLDREDTNGNYEPSNCRFITKIENQNNTRASVRFEHNGELKTRQEMMEIHGISLSTTYNWEKTGKLKRKMLYEEEKD
ncbi:hypothetical protein MZM54_03645 [[Brevibacterium] frigoritolerans]|nr:hypothetical protein [Peribacillus frigoritolerans]